MRWSCVWANTARSVSFEANDKLLTGRRLENNASAPVFFNLGLTSASFQSSGKVPHCRERLIILMITGRGASRHSTTKGVGIGSRRHVFLLYFPIKLLASFWLRILKEASWAEFECGGSNDGLESVVAAVSSLVRMRSVFCTKNFPISLANFASSW